MQDLQASGRGSKASTTTTASGIPGRIRTRIGSTRAPTGPKTTGLAASARGRTTSEASGAAHVLGVADRDPWLGPADSGVWPARVGVLGLRGGPLLPAGPLGGRPVHAGRRLPPLPAAPPARGSLPVSAPRAPAARLCYKGVAHGAPHGGRPPWTKGESHV